MVGGDTVAYVRMIEGKFPDYRAILPKTFDNFILCRFWLSLFQ
jgi:DNA polymerase III sliding clamp (beta) subunit (PCNA family)